MRKAALLAILLALAIAVPISLEAQTITVVTEKTLLDSNSPTYLEELIKDHVGKAERFGKVVFSTCKTSLSIPISISVNRDSREWTKITITSYVTCLNK